MALAVAYFTSQTNVVGSTQIGTWTAPTTYVRDLVIANGGTTAVYVSVGTAVTSASSTSSMQIPAGQSVCLMGPVPTSAVAYAIAGTGTVSTVSLGWASVVSVI